jgi:hypothetical protein
MTQTTRLIVPYAKEKLEQIKQLPEVADATLKNKGVPDDLFIDVNATDAVAAEKVKQEIDFETCPFYVNIS